MRTSFLVAEAFLLRCGNSSLVFSLTMQWWLWIMLIIFNKNIELSRTFFHHFMIKQSLELLFIKKIIILICNDTHWISLSLKNYCTLWEWYRGLWVKLKSTYTRLPLQYIIPRWVSELFASLFHNTIRVGVGRTTTGSWQTVRTCRENTWHRR